MTKKQLEEQLQYLREKWTGKVPKNNSNPHYWEFRCDRCIAERLKNQIENFQEIELQTAAELIFGK